MQIRAVAVLALCVTQFQPSFAMRDFSTYWYATEHPVDRLIVLMRNIYVTGVSRIGQLQYERSQYENTLDFEMGYIMGEIIERYRQLVVHLKTALKQKNMKVYDKLMRLEFMQKLYFEIYHLVMMMHELPRKYGHKADELTSGIEGAHNDNSTLFQAMLEMPLREEERERERRHKMKELQEEQAHLIEHGEMPERTTKSQVRFWPIDYGWSIENW